MSKPSAERATEPAAPSPSDSITNAFFEGIAEQKAESAVDRLRQDLKRGSYDSDGLVPMPGGRLERVADLIDHDYIAENHTSIFSDAQKYLKDPKPGAMYCWPSIIGKQANKTFGMERSGYYRRVEQSELREDITLPLYTHAGPTGEYVCVYDVCLMEMPAEVVKKLRTHPRQGALLRTVQGAPFRNFAGRVSDMTGGDVRAEMDVTTDDGKKVTLQ